MPEWDPESGWSVLALEAVQREEWAQAGRHEETFDLRSHIPELALKLAEGIDLDGGEQVLIAALLRDPECAALLTETEHSLRSLDERAVVERLVEDDAMTWTPVPQPLPPIQSGHSTPTMVAVALCSAAAAVALFAWLAPERVEPPQPAPVSAINPPIIVPTPVGVGQCGELESTTTEKDTDAVIESVAQQSNLLEAVDEVADLGLVPDAVEPSGRSRRRPKSSSSPDNDGYAGELLSKARKVHFKNPRESYSLAKVSNYLRPSTDAVYVMASSACRMKDAARAKAAIEKLEGEGRKTMERSCARQGVNLALDSWMPSSKTR